MPQITTSENTKEAIREAAQKAGLSMTSYMELLISNYQNQEKRIEAQQKTIDRLEASGMGCTHRDLLLQVFLPSSGCVIDLQPIDEDVERIYIDLEGKGLRIYINIRKKDGAATSWGCVKDMRPFKA